MEKGGFLRRGSDMKLDVLGIALRMGGEGLSTDHGWGAC